jgi:phage gpG-like protein
MDVAWKDELTPVLQRIKERALDPSAPLAAIGERMVESTKQTFMEQGRPSKWKALALSTVFGRLGVGVVGGNILLNGQKAFTKRALERGDFSVGGLQKSAVKKIENMKILIKSRRLFSSINKQVAGNVVEWGTNVKYAAMQNFGGQGPQGQTISARQYIMDPFPEDWKVIEGILTQFAFEGTE